MRAHPFRVRLTISVALLTILIGWFSLPQQAAAQTGSVIVTITSPSSGSTVSGSITVTASVSVVGVLVQGVRFTLDGAALGSEDTSAPYAVSWNTTTTGNGSHTLKAIARDALGLTYDSSPVTVTVSNGPPPDTTPPTVSISSPANGATVSGTINVTANANDNVGVAGVQFLVDGSALGAEDTVSPFSASWNTTSASNGSHSLTAVARDAAGNRTTSATVAVTVSNGPPPDTTPPTVSITSPASGATVSGTITVAANASDNVGVAGVQFLVDGATLGAEDTSAPYSVAWNTASASNGSHSLTAVARDAAGNRKTSAAVAVTVSNGPPPDTTPPTVSISSPANGATVSGTVNVTANANDNVGVAGVQFLVDGSALGAEDTTSPYSASWNTTSASNGSHSLTAVARDAAGNRTTSAAVAVTVSNGGGGDTTPPAVNITSPGAGATVSGTINVTANASDNVGVAGVQFMLDGAALGAEDTASPYSVAWNTTTSANGSHSLTAVARDAAGNRTTSSAAIVTVSNGGGGGGTTRSEETAATLAPAGAWTPISSAAAGVTLSGDQAVYSAAAGATATFTFTGTGVSWIGFKCEVCGTARVHVDASSVVTIDTYAPSRPAASGVLYSTTGLPSASHTVVIEVTGAANASSGGANIDVDAFDVEGASGGGGGDTTPPTVSITSPAGGATVTGTISVTASASDNVGVAGVQFLVDGAPIGAEDTSSPYAASWDTTTASNGSHSLTAVARDAAGNRATSAAVAVTASNGGGGGSAHRVEENDPSVQYTGSWIPQSRADLSGGSVVESNDPSGTATLTFTGTGVSWIGFRGPWAGIAQVYLDGALKATVDTYSPTEQAQAVMYTASGLASGSHTIKIQVTGTYSSSSSSAWVVVDAFDVN